MENRKLICEKLKQARNEASLKQEMVAKYLQIPTSAVSAFESGNRKIDAVELYMLSKLYKKPMEWFFNDYLSLKLISANTENNSFPVDPLVNQCIQLLERAPHNRRKAAAYGLIGFLNEDS
ncbi:MAG: helix-turn-helix transcriptional regulator [Cyanobacteria bacterium P01_H01_bin.74]